MYSCIGRILEDLIFWQKHWRYPIYKFTGIKVKLVTVVEGDPKAPFSIATTPRCRGGHYSFPWIGPLYPWSLPYNAELSHVASSTIFCVFGMTQPGIESRSPGRTL